MIVELATAGSLYTPEDAAKLEDFGFKFDNDSFDRTKRKHKITDHVIVDIATMEELMHFVDRWEYDVIVSRNCDSDTCQARVVIYDDYVE